MLSEILQVCVGRPREISFEGKPVTTSIFKSPVNGEVFAAYSNLDGDRQADLTVHGGRDKAIYVYSQDYYALWASDLNVPVLEPAQFGENLTVSGCQDADIIIGDRYRMGSAEVVVTQPRIPCFKLGVRFNNKLLPKLFWEKGRLGFYLRVTKEGVLKSGDAIELLERPKHNISVWDLWRTVIEEDRPGAARALNDLAHIDDGWKKRLKIAASKPGT